MAQDKIGQVEKLLSLIKASKLDKVALEVEGIKIKVQRKVVAGPAVVSMPVGASPTADRTTFMPAAAEVPPAAPSAAPSAAEGAGQLIKAPMIGTFYVASNPESPPFVQVGDAVKKGQTVCIIEAMKLFNEIEAEADGRIAEVLVENGTPVEYDQPLFRLEAA